MKATWWRQALFNYANQIGESQTSCWQDPTYWIDLHLDYGYDPPDLTETMPTKNYGNEFPRILSICLGNLWNLYRNDKVLQKRNTCFLTNVIAGKKRSVIGVKVALRINGTDLRQMPSQEGFYHHLWSYFAAKTPFFAVYGDSFAERRNVVLRLRPF